MPVFELRYGSDAETRVGLGQYRRGDLARSLARVGIAIETLPVRLEEALAILSRRGVNLASDSQGELAVLLKQRQRP